MRTVLLCIILLAGWSTPVFNQQAKEITNSIGMKMVLIHPGSFTMGSPEEEKGRGPNETQHEVTISKSYYLGAYEVTQSEYEKLIGKSLSIHKGPKNPVEMVSWKDAVTFCKMLTELPEEKEAKREYRLPTDAEWEYACRATSSAAYCFGDSPESLDEYAWYGEGRQSKTHPVGEKKANRWGLYDMHGNVWELCQDWYSEGLPESATDPSGPQAGTRRVMRGGSWEFDMFVCRSASKGGLDTKLVSHTIGFRVAMNLPPKQTESEGPPSK